MQLRKYIKAYLIFTRKDRLGVIAVLAIVVLIIVLPILTAPPQNSFPAKETVVLVQQMDSTADADSMLARQAGYGSNTKVRLETAPAFVEGELFPFDPNTLPIEGWQRLGLNKRIAAVIDNYRNKGGKFYQPSDIKNIWGMPDGFYERVKNFIVIEPKAKTYPADLYRKTTFTRSEKQPPVVNINQAGTDELIALPGIGSTLANRILKFRESLGGFYFVEQIRQVYGLPDSTFQNIKNYLQVIGPVKALNINSATKDELKTHPYISWNLANAIVEYRNQHGAFESLNDLKNIVLMDDETFNRLVPYLQVK